MNSSKNRKKESGVSDTGVPDTSPYLPQQAKVDCVVKVTEKERFFTLKTSTLIKHTPGQFLMIGLPGYGECPISISSEADSANLELCIREVGNVTRALHRLKKGDTVWIRGPFGKGFPVKALKGKDILFIAGGIGLAPMRSLIKTVISKKKSFGRLTLLYGVKSPEEILFKEELKNWEKTGVDVKLTVDRPYPGWSGNTGVVTTLIPTIAVNELNTSAILIGPPVMYKYVILSLGDKKLKDADIFLSLERRMRCGLGKCGHCQIASVYTCQEGPVFNLSEIRHLREAI